MTEIDLSYKGKSARVFGALWGAMKASGFDDNQISTLKPIAWRTLDECFVAEYDYTEARDRFTDAILDGLEAFGANDAQLATIERALFETLKFNFDESRGNQ